MARIPTDKLHLDMEKFAHIIDDTADAQPNFSLGIKSSWNNYADIIEPLLFYFHTDWLTGHVLPIENTLALRLEALQAIAENPDFDLGNLQKAIEFCTIGDSVGWGSLDIFWHSTLPGKYTCFVQPSALLALSLIKNGTFRLKKAFSSKFELISASDVFSHQQQTGIKLRSLKKLGVIIENVGLLISGSSIEECSHTIDQFQTQLASLITIPPYLSDSESGTEISDFSQNLPEHRQTISNEVGYPIILQPNNNHSLYTLTKNELSRSILRNNGAFLSLMSRVNIQFNKISVSDSTTTATQGRLSEEFETPCVVSDPKFGTFSIGRNISEVGYTQQVLNTLAKVILTALEQGELEYPLHNQAEDTPKPFKFRETPPLPYTGEIGLVTGAASGIGKACAESLLLRGAVVIGLDINPGIESTFKHENYLGLVCDISDEMKIIETMNQIRQTFGGLDMLILNAGLFPKGCNINNVHLNEFTEVLNINLKSNLVLMREAYPLLKYSPRYGRVVIVGSKNVKAPGPGAVAYSTSKAGLVQMARVAAMEWASDGIRVNVIHPDAVFDTALYTEDVLRARAEFYNMTIDEYKKRNLLKTEITSQIIAEMIAEMCGKLFTATTGSQIQVDGGNDRTI